MAFQNVFKRYELRYMLTVKQKDSILEEMKLYMELDKYGRSTIRNVYLDTDKYRLIRRSLEKPVYKEKIRIRSYNQATNESVVFVELKKKYEKIVYKRRLPLTELEAVAWISRESLCPVDTQISREIVYMWKNEYTKSFLVTLALLPAVVCVVIMMVNGNIGAGVAVAGAFSLVRFRSAPGSAKEIVTIFLAMGAGLIAGMGYLAFAILFTIIMCVMFTLYNLLAYHRTGKSDLNKTIKISIPEDLDYTGVFEDIFAEYTCENELIKVKTINMGSMFRLTYNVKLKDTASEKQMIDRIRERNGNLEIMVSKQENRVIEL